MNFAAIEDRYLRQYTKLGTKVLNTFKKQPTANQTKGFAFYLEAARRVRLLMDVNPAPEGLGFVMKSAAELAPVRMGFSTLVEVSV